MIKSLAFAAAAFTIITTSTAAASTISLLDRSSFLAAGGEATFYKIGDDLIGVDDPNGDFTGPAAISSLGQRFEFANGNLAASPFPQGRDGTLGVVPEGRDDFLFLLAEPAFGFGFDFVKDRELSGCSDIFSLCANTQLTLTLFNDDEAVGSEFFALPETEIFDAFFLGVQSTLAFDTVRVAETIPIASTEFNNEGIYLNFVTTDAPLQAVPLPAPLFMLLGGIGVLGLMQVRPRHS